MTDLEQDESRYIVKALDSALDVLEVVSRHPGNTLSDLAKKSGLNKSRTMRFLVTFEARDIVRKDREGRFYLATRTLVLGGRARDQMDSLKLIQPILDRIRDKTSETVQYRVLDGLQTVCLAKADSQLAVRVHTETGRPRELNVGSSKSILAFGGADLLQEFLENPKTSYSPNTVADLLQQLEEIRENGFSVSESERIEGAIALGAPIFNSDGSVKCCLSLLGPQFRIGSMVKELGQMLIEAAREVQRALPDS